ncbi:MAG: hypothetical protein ABI091_26900 [Ferruginibacter sp.]
MEDFNFYDGFICPDCERPGEGCICASNDQYDKLKEDNERYEKAIVSLTPGGSEFIGDPEYCAKIVKEFQASQHKVICNITLEKKELQRNNALLIEALDVMLDTFVYRNKPTANQKIVSLEFAVSVWNKTHPNQFKSIGDLMNAEKIIASK